MKTQLSLSIAGFLALACVSASAQAPDYSKLTALWRLNGDASDNYSTNNGTWTAGPAAYIAGPKAGTQAAMFWGTNWIDTTPAAGSFEISNAFSVTAWVNGPPNEACVVSKLDPGHGYVGWELHDGGFGRNVPQMWIVNAFDFFGSTSFYAEGATPVTDGASWHHVAVTYDGSGAYTGLTVYVDGAVSSGLSGGGTNLPTILNNIPLRLGARSLSGDQPYAGALAEVSLWSTNLSSDQVLYIESNGVTPPTLINSFNADSTLVYPGQSDVFHWNVTSGSTVSIDHGAGDVTTSMTNGIGAKAVTVPTTATYTLTATLGAQNSTKTLTVATKPLIVSFAPSQPTTGPGQPVALNWQASPLASLTIDHGVGSVNGDTSTTGAGSVLVSPTSTTTYTLTATYGGSNATAQATLIVIPPIPPNPSSLVGYWPLNGNALDYLGANNGTWGGTESYAAGRGQGVRPPS